MQSPPLLQNRICQSNKKNTHKNSNRPKLFKKAAPSALIRAMQTGAPGYRCVRAADTYERDSMLLKQSHRLERAGGSSEPTSAAHAWVNTLLAVLALLIASLSALQQPPFVRHEVGPGEIADGAVGRYNLGDAAVTRDKMADGAVAGSVLAAGGVGSAALASEAVTRRALAEGSVGALQLGEGVVRSSHLADGAVLARSLAEGAVTSDALAHGAVGAGHLSADLLRVLSQTVQNASSRGSTCGARPRARRSVVGDRTGGVRGHRATGVCGDPIKQVRTGNPHPPFPLWPPSTPHRQELLPPVRRWQPAGSSSNPQRPPAPLWALYAFPVSSKQP